MSKKHGLLLLSAVLSAQAIVSSPEAMAMGKKQPESGATTVSPSLINSQDPIATKIAVESILNEELIYRTVYRDKALKDLIPFNEMDGLEAAWFGAITRFISENPGLFGGNPNRGYNPKILKSMIRVFRERAIPMTSDGILLPPRNGLELRVLANEVTASGALKGARLFLVDKQGQIIGPDMRPLTQTAFETLDGDTVSLGNQIDEFARYANLQETLRTQGLRVKALETPPNDNQPVDPEEHTWGQCMGLAADEKYGEAAACFKAAGQETLAAGAELAQDLAATAGRGAVGGAIVGSAFPGIGTSAGAAYGALGNMLGVLYNAFLRKESVTPQAMRDLMDFMSRYTFSPSVYGEVLPKNGQWAVTKAGFVRRVTEFNGKLVLLDVLGNPVTKTTAITVAGDRFRSVPGSEQPGNGGGVTAGTGSAGVVSGTGSAALNVTSRKAPFDF